MGRNQIMNPNSAIQKTPLRPNVNVIVTSNVVHPHSSPQNGLPPKSISENIQNGFKPDDRKVSADGINDNSKKDKKPRKPRTPKEKKPPKDPNAPKPEIE